LLDRVHASMFHWWRLVGRASPGARVLQPPGVVAAVVPAAPERAVVNSVLYETVDALEPAYDDVARAYAEIGAKWTVWVQPAGRERAASLLGDRGHALDAEPTAMARTLDDALGRPPSDALRDWTAQGDLGDVGPINDRAYPFGTDSFSRSLTNLPDDAAHIYVARRDGEPAACLMMIDSGGNSEVQMVAVVPEARGAGLAAKLLAHALMDAAHRGNSTSTLIATKLGYPVYERLGFEPVGSFQMWEISLPRTGKVRPP
jgi:N-acetylglutamate synthase-like GNAT family acetyltransferase